ncbi:MAG TPA: phenylalanine--tRNA ligase beta subunit-related protein [Candidatus Paceibacterota bacterium]|nr:phenylalanine--tRNA ligase beta subunit-related protein [Candidatus Paceibacterota bacterium]
MLFSYRWLQEHFDDPLPNPQELADYLTLHSFEVESVAEEKDDFVLDIDILPNRSSDCLSHEGVAKEISVLFEKKTKTPEHFQIQEIESKPTKLQISVEDSKLCPRYIGRKVSRITVAESPLWMKEKLQAIGQKSINNIVDATNVIMYETGQPLHAFDADKLDGEKIFVRLARSGEKITTLDGKEVPLDENTLVIADAKDPLAIAGVKGGKKAEVDKNTKNIVLESANFHPTNIRKTSARVNIRTDSSKRFENEVPLKVAEEGMETVSSVLLKLHQNSGSDKEQPIFEEKIDIYPEKYRQIKISVNPSRVSDILGVEISEDVLEETLHRLEFPYEKTNVIQKMLDLAPKYAGTKYAYGADQSTGKTEPKSFDSSSLIQFLFAEAGMLVPRLAVDQYFFGEEVAFADMLPGDVVFSNAAEEQIYFKSVHFLPGKELPEGVDHAGLYLGEGNILHTSREQQKAVIEKMKESKQFKKVVGVRRMADPHKERWLVSVPEHRLDLERPEDIVEEIGRIYGYEKISAKPLPTETFSPKIHRLFFAVNKIRNILFTLGFSEIYTHTLQRKGDVRVANPMAQDKAFLRTSLLENMQKSLDLNEKNAPLFGEEVLTLFEIGIVFPEGKEHTALAIGIRDTKRKKQQRAEEIFQKVEEGFQEAFGKKLPHREGETVEINLDEFIADIPEKFSYEDVLEKKAAGEKYESISSYPFLLRDIAVFVSEGEDAFEILRLISEEGKDLLVRTTLFDIFEKTFEDGLKKTSYAYHIVFQAKDRTLSDEEANRIMDQVTKRLNEKPGFSVR